MVQRRNHTKNSPYRWCVTLNLMTRHVLIFTRSRSSPRSHTLGDTGDDNCNQDGRRVRSWLEVARILSGVCHLRHRQLSARQCLNIRAKPQLVTCSTSSLLIVAPLFSQTSQGLISII